MKLYAHLLLAAFALHVRAATIPEKLQSEVIKLDIPEVPKGAIEAISVEPEESNLVKDAENTLRVNGIEDIPVKVVVEDVPVLKSSEEGNEVPKELLKKIREEVKDPGSPQRQEHETQNPEHHVDVSTLKQAIQDTQSLLRQGFQGVSEGISNFVTNNDQINSIQNSIQLLQKSFTERIQQLNATIGNFLQYENVEVKDNVPEAQIRADIQTVENRLQTLENHFNEGIKNLAKGVQAMGAAKAEGENTEGSSTTAPATGSQQTNPVMEMLANFQESMSQSFSTVMQNIQNVFNNQQNGSPSAGAQSDEGTTTSRPFFANFPNPLNILNQNNQTQQQSGPLMTFFDGFANFLRPGAQSTTEKPASGSQEPSAPSTPAADKEPEKKPEPEAKPEEPQKNTGPIRQILESNPIVQGITGVVQRLQQNNNKPEKPRETDNKDEKKEPEKIEPASAEPVVVEPVKVEPVKVEAENVAPEKTEEEKGLLFIQGHGHGGYGNGSGDNLDSRGELKEEVAKKPSPEILKDEVVLVQEKTE